MSFGLSLQLALMKRELTPETPAFGLGLPCITSWNLSDLEASERGKSPMAVWGEKLSHHFQAQDVIQLLKDSCHHFEMCRFGLMDKEKIVQSMERYDKGMAYLDRFEVDFAIKRHLFSAKNARALARTSTKLSRALQRLADQALKSSQAPVSADLAVLAKQIEAETLEIDRWADELAVQEAAEVQAKQLEKQPRSTASGASPEDHSPGFIAMAWQNLGSTGQMIVVCAFVSFVAAVVLMKIIF